MLEALASGQFAASVFEFPGCRVEAESKEVAIAQIQKTFLDRLQHMEAIVWDVPKPILSSTWESFVGVFSGDPDFAAIMESIRAERNADDDSEIDPSFYQ